MARRASKVFRRQGAGLSRPPLAEFKRRFPGAAELTPREYEVYVARQSKNVGGSAEECRWIDVSQRLERTTSTRALPSVTPGAKYFIESQMRVITGVEMLMSQGIRFCDERLQILKHRSDHLFGDLAGNVFAMCHVAAVQFVIHGILSSLHQCSEGSGVIVFPLTGERDVAKSPKESVLDFFADSE